MSSSKCTITIRQLLCHVFIFASFFHVFSNGFTWIQAPSPKIEAEIGTSMTLRWLYNISNNETHYQSDLILEKENKDTLFHANRHSNAADFKILVENKLVAVHFTVNGSTTDVRFTLLYVRRRFDGSFCFKVIYTDIKGKSFTMSKCSKLFTFAKPLVDFSPKPMLVNVTDQVPLYCNATGKPEPDIIWKKADNLSAELSMSSWFNLAVTGATVQGLYLCIANNSFGTHNKTFFLEVQYKPEIHYISNEQIRPEGATALLYCNASGNPIPNIRWAKTGTTGDILIRGQGNASLELTNISRADTGGYFCIAKNLLGRTYNRTSLTVQYRPVETHIAAKPGPEVILGKTLVLSCTSSALPEVNQYKFFHNGTFFKNVTDGVLGISNITSSEGGEYECVPSNTLGKGDPARLKINVLVPPELYEPLPNNITINESDTLELRCKAKGNPLPVITWTKDSKFILQSNTYTKENASRYDAGVYRCTAKNTIVKPVYSETTVIVNYAPEITFITTDAIVNETNDVSLYCNASGHPNPRLQWFKGNASIGTESIGTASKTLMNVKWKQGGNYVCQAKNFLGTKFATTKLDVQYKPINTKLTTNTGKHEVAIHETLVLNCSAQAFPPANLFIFSTTKNSTLQESPISTYTISREIWSPAEQYTCLPKNILGEGLPDSVNISFLEQPSFRKLLPENKSLTVNETGKIELKCLVRGTPKPNVTWTKDGTSKIIGEYDVFTKNNTNRSDNGTYRCRASNGVGRILEAVFSVVVYYKPINTRLISINGRNGVIVNESLTLNCSAESFPEERSYSFQVNGSTINRTSSNSTFTIMKDRPFDDENYTCIATNLLGSGKKSNILTITMFERPVIYSEPENVTVRENVTITLMCQARGKPWPTITWTKGDSMDTIGTGETYSKAKAEKCDAGVYRCTADNGVKGSVSAQATVIVESYPEVPEIKSIAISIPRIEVHWKQPATNCSHPTTGYIAQVRKKGSQKKWTQCEARYVENSDLWSCSFEDLESSKTYTLQIYAKNRFGTGQPAEKDFVTKGDGARGSTDASKGELSTTDYFTIGGSVGGFFLLIIIFIIVIVKRLRTNHGESSLQTPIELREVEEVQIHASYKIEKQNCYEGPMTASQETLDVNETKEKEETLKVKLTEEKEAKDSAEDNKL